MNTFWKHLVTMLLLTITTKSVPISGLDFEMQLTAEDAILMNELEWAEKAMVSYREKRGVIPVRSPIRGASYDEWKRDSIDFFAEQNSQDPTPTIAEYGGLRGVGR